MEISKEQEFEHSDKPFDLYNSENIRNVSVIGNFSHGKSTIVDTLIEKASLLNLEKEFGTRYTDTREDEKLRGISIKSVSTSLYCEVDPSGTDNDENKEGYLINLIDSPGHVDFSSEVKAALRVTDGALLVVDYAEGVCIQTKAVLSQALTEKVKPVLMINKIDRGMLELETDGEEMYQQFQRVIYSINSEIQRFDYLDSENTGFKEENKEMNETFSGLIVDPTNLTVAFGSGDHGWAFTLNTFARIYSIKFGIHQDSMISKLWGENYYNKKSRKWTTSPSSVDSESPMERSFVQFVLNPILRLSKVVMSGDLNKTLKMLKALSISLNPEEQNKRSKALLKVVFQRWLNAADTLLEMIVMKLPSPKQAQRYRVEYLYEGPIDDECAEAIRECDQDGPLMIFVPKLIPKMDNKRFYALGRVFSGVLRAGEKVRIMGPNYIPGK